MPDNKKQHFVPQFHLRNFSSASHGKTIHLYNLRLKRVIFDVSISGQSFKPYLYGEDGELERILGLLESSTSPVFKSIIRELKTPQRFSPEHAIIIQFMAMQYGRTEAREIETDDMMDRLAKLFIGDSDPKLAEDLKNFKITWKNTPMVNVQHTATLAPLLYDLDCKLLRTTGDSRIITSDNPVIFLNQFLDKRHMRFSRGFASKGLQIYCPISPSHALFLYDRDLYKIGRRSATLVEIGDNDVDILNIIQLLYCNQNLYFSEICDSVAIQRMATAYIMRKPLQRTRFETYGPVATEEGSSEIFWMGARRAKFYPELSFCKLKRRVEKRPIPGLRNPVLTVIVQDFAAQIDKGGTTDFPLFAKRHPLMYQLKF